MAFAGMSIGCAHVSTHHVGMDAAMLGLSHLTYHALLCGCYPCIDACLACMASAGVHV